MPIEDLIERGIAPQLVDLWKAQGIQALTPCQESAFSFDPLWSGSNLIIVAPHVCRQDVHRGKYWLYSPL